MKKITYVCDACAHQAMSEAELVSLDDAGGDTVVASQPFVVTGQNRMDHIMSIDIIIHNESRAEVHMCNECIVGQLENVITEMRGRV